MNGIKIIKKIMPVMIMAALSVQATHSFALEEAAADFCVAPDHPGARLTESAVVDALGWIKADINRCGGYYLEPPFLPPTDLLQSNYIDLTGEQGTFSLHGTSVYEGKVTITENGQQIIANKAYVYREPVTEKYSKVDLIGHVILREPNELVLATCGQFNFQTKNKSLYDILYRMAIYGPYSQKPVKTNNQQIALERKVSQLSAWGTASWFKQETPQVYEFKDATYSTCPPVTNIWTVKAKNIVLDKNTGRGVAKNARLYIKNIPVFYTPYLNFPIDDRRQSGFLWPRIGSSGTSGGYLSTPYYWNIAPNYDDFITPTYFSKRGLQLTDLFRYLTPYGRGNVSATVLPDDRAFSAFKNSQAEQNAGTTNNITQAELNRLENASTTRKAFTWIDNTQYNKHWSSAVNVSYVSDDYYLKDFRNNVDEITPNQLLQEADLNYQSQYWHFLGRVQGYETLHPIDQNTFANQYMRLPELVLEGDYYDDRSGFDYFIYNDMTHFDINKNPGVDTEMPIGNRAHTQPGVSRPFYRPYFYVIPRLQFAFTQYSLQQVADNNTRNPRRALPIFDIHSGLYFDRDTHFFSHALRQTLEPQIYYTYVPYRNQNDIPIFDTTTNTLTYDQLFNYNRFSGLDRIGDANQISLGVTTRFIDEETGFEKIRAGVGQIFYFEDRRVTLCDQGDACDDAAPLDENTEPSSPLSAVLVYNLTPHWSATGDAIWDYKNNNVNNRTLTILYSGDIRHVITLSYSFVKNGNPEDNDDDPLDEDNDNDLATTDLSFAWPLTRDWSTIGRWTQNWSQGHFQNLLYGLEYDSCCWAIRLVGGRIFTNQTADDRPQYNSEFYVQFALKGLGSFGSGNPGHLINSTVIGNKNYFGQDY